MNLYAMNVIPTLAMVQFKFKHGQGYFPQLVNG